MLVQRGLRLLVFDATCEGTRLVPGLSLAWSTGARLYRALGRIDASLGVRSWAEALAFLATHEASRPVSEVQYWGHGNFGRILVANDVLDTQSLAAPTHRASLDALRDRLARSRASGREPLVWLRTCEAFGGEKGQTFAKALATRLDTRVAGHTHVIGVLQSGLVSLRPGEEPTWPTTLGVTHQGETAQGRPSSLREPRTVHFLTGRLPTWAND